MKDAQFFCLHRFLRLESEMSFSRDELIKGFFELDQLYFPTPWELLSWGQLLMAPDRELSLSWLEDSKGNITGLCLFLVNQEDQFAHLVKIFVIPSAMKMGLGSLLLGDAEQSLERAGIRQFYLEVEQSNKGAIALYLKHSYRKIHHRRDFYGPGRGADIMERRA